MSDGVWVAWHIRSFGFLFRVLLNMMTVNGRRCRRCLLSAHGPVPFSIQNHVHIQLLKAGFAKYIHTICAVGK
jgi:hypothetical protein